MEQMTSIDDAYRRAGRSAHQEDTVIDIGGVKIGGGHFAVMAGPCAIESREQILAIAAAVRASRAQFLRGGAFKPRTSPYDFQGLGKEGLALLSEAKEKTGLQTVSECVDAGELPLFEDVDIIQVGARNMQNYALLKALGRSKKPVLLKRAPAATLREFLLSAEYILDGGNDRVILCERGVRVADEHMRHTPDIAALAMLKDLTHLPVIADPSHASGTARYVPKIACAQCAAGTDGLIIEVHNDPKSALSDGGQALTCEAFDHLMKRIAQIRTVFN